MNEENLIPMNERSQEEARELGRKGGIESGKTRRKRKAMKEQAEMLMSLPFQDIKVYDQNGNEKSVLEEFKKISGIENADEIDNQMALIISLWKQGISGGKSSVLATNTLMELLGEKKTKVDVKGGKIQISFNGENELEE